MSKCESEKVRKSVSERKICASAHFSQSIWTMLGRLHRIAEQLQRGQWLTAAELARAEEVSPKTIYRSIDFLRDQLGWDIEGANSGLKLHQRGKPLLARAHSPTFPLSPQPTFQPCGP